ncbi:MAG TPA: alpha/beta fold hydrolase [Lacipirellulaceae bacterium]|nr:alpha/beta fold hydrolase [Lacipirellulaceae bacterium]
MCWVVLCVPLGIAARGAVARAELRWFDSAGVQIAYLEQGVGEPVVLLHGFSLSAAEMWTRLPWAPTSVLAALAEEHRVIAPDLRGHGASDKPLDPGHYGVAMADDVIRLLDHLGVQRAHIVGYSMGATIAGELLVSHPERLLSVTFGGGGPLVRPSPVVIATMESTAESLERGLGMVPLVMALTPPDRPRPSPLEAGLVSRMMLAGKDQLALAAVMRGLQQLEVDEAKLSACTTPVAFAYGGREAATKVEMIAIAIDLLSHAEVTVIPGRDHLTTVGSPSFLAAIRKNVRAQRP